MSDSSKKEACGIFGIIDSVDAENTTGLFLGRIRHQISSKRSVTKNLSHTKVRQQRWSYDPTGYHFVTASRKSPGDYGVPPRKFSKRSRSLPHSYRHKRTNEPCSPMRRSITPEQALWALDPLLRPTRSEDLVPWAPGRDWASRWRNRSNLRRLWKEQCVWLPACARSEPVFEGRPVCAVAAQPPGQVVPCREAADSIQLWCLEG